MKIGFISSKFINTQSEEMRALRAAVPTQQSAHHPQQEVKKEAAALSTEEQSGLEQAAPTPSVSVGHTQRSRVLENIPE